MANKRLPMRKIKEVLRLKYVCGLGERDIAQSCQVSRTTVVNYLKRAEAAGLDWPVVAGLSEAELEFRLFQRTRRDHCPIANTSMTSYATTRRLI